jgi:peptidoglycan pentaglycine glycine transferase (the first glycine)
MDAKQWNSFLSKLPYSHLLQTWQWGQAKQPFGWHAFYKKWESKDGKPLAAALILERKIEIPLLTRSINMLYLPKGPILADWENEDLRAMIMKDLKDFAIQRNAFLIKIDPDLSLGIGLPGDDSAQEFSLAEQFLTELKLEGWRFSNEQVQMRNTMLIDLHPSEEELLASMKQKTRYNVRLAMRKGAQVRIGDQSDFDTLFSMYAETAVRDNFVIRSKAYYFEVWQTFFDAGMLKPLIAEVEGEPVAGLMLFIFNEQAWYIYGMSRNLHRDKMPNYLLQWEAIRAAKAAGCEIYDLWGAPDDFDKSDPMWGVYRFKKGLAAYEARRIGAWDYPVNKWIYALYSQVLPRIISIMRWRGKRKTASQVNTTFDQ